MKVAFFGAKSYDKTYFERLNHRRAQHQLVFFDAHLDSSTASLASGFRAVCVFVNDRVNSECLSRLSESGVEVIALRCAGFNNIDLEAAAKNNIQVVRVPDYSPHGVAEHAVALILSLNRKIHRAFNRTREKNFLLEGLLGFNLHGKTVGVVGTGKIGAAFCKIMKGFGCEILAYDLNRNSDLEKEGIKFVDLDKLFASSNIISLHCPLTPETHHLIGEQSISKMQDGVMLINTSRGALIDTSAVIKFLKSKKVGYLGLDVYEEEEDLFFEDTSNEILEDDVFARLLTFPNVLITGHQAFFTDEALYRIAETTLQNLSNIEDGKQCANSVQAPKPPNL